jgi:hypothetical protein
MAPTLISNAWVRFCLAGAIAAPAASDAATPVVAGFSAAAVPTGFWIVLRSDCRVDDGVAGAASSFGSVDPAFCSVVPGLSGSSGGGTESCAEATSNPAVKTNAASERKGRVLYFFILTARNKTLNNAAAIAHPVQPVDRVRKCFIQRTIVSALLT